MKRILFITLIALIISSCSTIEFETSLPKDTELLTQFPNEIIGNYIDGNKDTLQILASSFKYGGKDKTLLYMNRELKKDSVELKQFNDFYILSFISENGSNTWGIIPFKIKKNKLIIYFCQLDKNAENLKTDVDSIITLVQEITPVKIIKEEGNEQTRYIANPSNEEFTKLLNSGYFLKLGELKKLKD